MATIQENARIHGRTEAGASGTKRGEASGLYRKLFELQSRMDGYGWEKDGTNNRHKYKYITEAQYKKNFKAARAQAGLLWKMEEVGHELIPIVSDKMHLVRGPGGTGTLIFEKRSRFVWHGQSGTVVTEQFAFQSIAGAEEVFHLITQARREVESARKNVAQLTGELNR